MTTIVVTFAISKIVIKVKPPNMPISNKAIEAIRTDSDLRAKLMLVESKSEYTIKRWIEANDDNLTMPKYTSVIAAHTGMTTNEILETESQLA